jgi:hypothetical protein
MMLLKFSPANAKLKHLEPLVGGKVFSFSTLAGVTCPYAKECESKAALGDDNRLKIVDGPHTLFRCFSASQEVLFKLTYAQRKYNMDMLATCGNNVEKYVELIQSSLPVKAKCIRINVSGDFTTQNYFDAWLQVARNNPGVWFYAYTKSLPFWVKRLNDIPENMVLTASRGGYRDNLIDEYKLRNVTVIHELDEVTRFVKSKNKNKMPKGSKYAGMPVDHDDSFACLPKHRNKNFALLVHAIQPKGSDAAKSESMLNGVGSYSKGK